MGNHLCQCGDICKDSLALASKPSSIQHCSYQNLLCTKAEKMITNDISNYKEGIDMKPNARLVESYNSHLNFYCTLKQIIRIQGCYKAHLRRKNRKKEIADQNEAINQVIAQKDIREDNVSNVEEIKDLPSGLYLSYSMTKFDRRTMTSFYFNTLSKKGEGIDDGNIKGYFLKKKKKYKYKGGHYVKKKEGFGIIQWEDGSKLFAVFKGSRVQGISKFTDALCNSKFSGYYEDNRPSGYGIYQRSDEARFEGIWTGNSLNDIGIEVWKDEYYYQGEFKDSIKNGIGLYRWPDGTLYQGFWNNNQMNGYGIMRYADDCIYTGQFQNGLMNGFGEFQWTVQKKKYIGGYEKDRKSGFGIFIWSFAPLTAHIGFWCDGNADGPGIKIIGSNVMYGVWKEGQKPIRLLGPWDLKRHFKGERVKHLAFFEKNVKLIIKFIETLE